MKYLNSLTMFVLCRTTRVPDVRLRFPCAQVWSTPFPQLFGRFGACALCRSEWRVYRRRAMKDTGCSSHLFICSVLCLEEGWKKRWACKTAIHLHKPWPPGTASLHAEPGTGLFLGLCPTAPQSLAASRRELLLDARDSRIKEHRPSGSLEMGHELCFCGKLCSVVRWGDALLPALPWAEGLGVDGALFNYCLTTILLPFFYRSPFTCRCPPAPGWLCRGSVHASSLPAQ